MKPTPDKPMTDASNPPAANGTLRRRKAMLAVTLLVSLAALAYGIYYVLVLSHYEITDNAYVQATVVQITPQLPGTVSAVLADDTDRVKAGQVLVRLDPADALVALDQAKAQLAQAVREARMLYAGNSTLAAQITTREAEALRAKADLERSRAELDRAQADLRRAQDDAARREPLLASGAVAREEYDHARSQAQSFSGQVAAAQSAVQAAQSAIAAAQSGVVAARAQLVTNQVLTDGTPVERHPTVQRAAARVHEAQLAVQRAHLISPIDGQVARRAVQTGQRVAAGAPLMSVVALEQVWVDANFKESQLANLRIGQPVSLHADLYGKQVEYHGKVDGLGAGTGSAFALLPAQNASGNWIKVVQRLPVRIALERAEVVTHPLRVGLSMRVTVDVTNREGALLPAAQHAPAAAVAPVVPPDPARIASDELVRRIIAENMGTR